MYLNFHHLATVGECVSDPVKLGGGVEGLVER